MPSYETAVRIAAPAELVWAVTLDVATWPEWSPTMDEVAPEAPGPVGPGSRVRVRQPRLRPAVWVVDEVVPGRRFVWHTSGPGYRISAPHLVRPNGDGTTVALGVHLGGLLAPVLWAVAGRTMRGYVDEEAAALKRRCETP